MYRVSVTLLDSFRLWRDLPEDQDWFPVEELEGRIRGEPFEPTVEMQIGTALHDIVERESHAAGADGGCFDSGGFAFDAYSVQPILDAFRGGLHEVKATTEIQTARGPVTLVGRADYLRGLEALELKTKIGRALDPEHYAGSVQWKAYILIFSLRRVVYHLAQLSDRGGVLEVFQYDTLPLYPYPTIRADVEHLVADFMDFCAARGLLPLLIRESHEAKDAA